MLLNLGPSSANFTADLTCSDQSLLITSTPQAECTNLSRDMNCTVTLIIRTNTSYLSAQTLECSLSASVSQSFGGLAYCWSSLGKQYAQSIALSYPVLITTQQPGMGTQSPNNGDSNNNSGGLFGIGEVSFILILLYHL